MGDGYGGAGHSACLRGSHKNSPISQRTGEPSLTWLLMGKTYEHLIVLMLEIQVLQEHTWEASWRR